MQTPRTLWFWWFRRLSYLVAAAVVCTGLLGVVLAQAADDPAWASPTVRALKKISALPTTQQAGTAFYNLDCTPAAYRLPTSSQMLNGCFTQTAFGWFDSDQGVAIFHGTDEAVSLIGASPNQVLTPWPRAVNLVALHTLSTGGASLHLYKNPLNVLQDQRDGFLRLTAKRLTAAPELTIRDTLGQPLVINAQTIAFSDNGSWLVAETLQGAFVRINLATLDMVAFAPAYGAQGHPGLLQSHIAVSDNGRYIAINNNTAEAFRVYDVASCGQPAGNLQPRTCQSYDYRPFITGQLTQVASIRHLRFMHDGLLTFSVHGSPDQQGVYGLAPSASIDNLLEYLALGDSFTSGEGAFNYRSGTDTANNSCHSSLHAYPILITQDLFSQQGGRSVACSGARIHDIANLSGNYRGQAKQAPTFSELQGQPQFFSQITTDFLPGYLAQLRFAKQYQPRIITVSVGGNDIGFGDIIEQCAVPQASLHRSDGDCFNTYEDRLEVLQLVDRTVRRWASLYRDLKGSAPAATVFVVGYPRVVDGTGHCEVNVRLSKGELEFAETLTVYLNSRIRQAALQAGVHFVDIEDALKGHRLCEARGSALAVNGLTAGKDIGILGVQVFGKESYHPNMLGQELMKQAILRQTKNFAAADSPARDDMRQALLAVPKSGRETVVRSPESAMTSRWLPTGVGVPLSVDGNLHGLRPNTNYSIRFDGPSGQIVTTTPTGSTGSISVVITLPSGIEQGGHTIDVIGPGSGDQTIVITQPVYVPHPGDADNDGQPDATDSCPTLPESGLDTDQDGIDDYCDGQIGTAPASSPVAATTEPKPGVISSLFSGIVDTIHNGPKALVRAASATTQPSIQKPNKATKHGESSPVNTQQKAPPEQCVREPWSPVWWLWLLLASLLWIILVTAFYGLRRATTQNMAAKA